MSNVTSLFITRCIAALLAVITLIVYTAYTRIEAQLSLVTDHALALYPYAPKLDRNFNFTMDYFGLTYKGNYSEDWQILFTGAAEKPDLYFLRDAMERISPDEGVFVDVGANKGAHTLFMSQHATKVIAYEPYPPVLNSLKEQVELNALKNVTLRDVGLGDANGILPFYISPDSIMTGSFDETFNKDGKVYAEAKIIRGDDDLDSLEIKKVHLLKIDVEGFEKNVLKGLVSTLERDRPIVLMELLADKTRDNSFKSEEDLRSVFPKEYRFFQFEEYEVYSGKYSLVPLDFEGRRKGGGNSLIIKPRNIAAIPSEAVSRVLKNGRPAA